jgi:Holliday junction resolvase-like predicted endonuclease
MKLAKIVTHHEDPKRAAEIYLKEELIAIGYIYEKSVAKKDKEKIKEYFRKQRGLTEQQVGQSTSIFLKFRDQIEEGNIVFAYAGDNKIALVGEVAGQCKFNDKNIVGDEKGDIGYPNQRKVKWYDSPRNFDRSFLPRELSEWVARPGALSIREYDIKKLQKILQEIPSEETVSITLEIHSEDEIKDYLEKHPGDVEEGLVLIQREYPTSTGPMDFLTKDKNGVHTVIEVKMEADDTTVTQIRRYMRAFKREKKVANIRGIIVAEEFNPRCIEDVAELAQHGFDLRLYKCRKKFHFELKKI